MKYDSIIFDFFGVICTEVALSWFADFFSKEKALELKDKYMELADRGNTTQEELFRELGGITGVQPIKIETDWNNMVSIDPKMIDLIKNLKVNYKLAICTNSMSSFLHKVLEEHHIEDLFDAIIISSEVKINKPEKKIFELTLQELKTIPEKAIFIDDNAMNVKAALNLGIVSLNFISIERLKRDLNSLNIKV